MEVLLPALIVYKYWLLFFVTFISALFLPATPGTFLMMGGAFASRGYFSIAGVFVVATLGNIIGDNLSFWIAREYGATVLRKIGLGKLIDSKKTKHIERGLHVHAGKIIFLTRFESFSKLAVNIVAGISGVPYKKYFYSCVLGNILQVAMYCAIGFFFGDSFHSTGGGKEKILFVLIILIVIFAEVFWKKIKNYFSD